MALINCPECGTQISDQATSCIKCGYPLASQSVPKPENPQCPECGNEVEEGAMECGKCGYPLTEKEKTISTENVNSEEQKYFEQIAFDTAYGIGKKSMIKKLMKMGLDEGKAVNMIFKVRESHAGRSLLVRKYRNQFIAGIIMFVLSFLMIGAATTDGANPPTLLIFILLFGFLFLIRGTYGWIKYRVPKHGNKIVA